MKHHPDVNDTLRIEGADAVRHRHDRAWSKRKPAPPPQVLPSPSDPMAVARKFVEPVACITVSPAS